MIEQDKTDIVWRLRANWSYLGREAADEIERLREAIRRLADQDATLSVCCGNVTVTMDGTLTDAEREAIQNAIGWIESPSVESEAMPEDYLPITNTLRGLLARCATDSE